MVVLELEGHTNMLGSGPNQYLQPDYMSPLSSPLDSKVSPLALLAQTCSQIGSDSPSSKSIFDTSKRKLSTCSESSLKSDSSSDSSSTNSKDVVNNNNKELSNGGNGSSSNSNHRPKSGGSSVSPFNHSPLTKSNGGGKSSPVLISSNPSPVFRPYEMSKPSKESSSERNSEKSTPKSSKHSSSSLSRSSANSSPKVKTPNPRSTPPEKEISVVDSKKGGHGQSGGHGSGRSSANPESKPTSSSSSHQPDQGTSPIIRSGLEVLQQGQFGSAAVAAEYNKRLSALSSLGAAGYPPFDPMNPAFRPPFFGAPHHPGFGYHLPGQSPYVSYSRVKTDNGQSIVPVCKDPYCSGCQLGSGHGSASSASSGSPSMNGLMGPGATGFPSSLSGGIPGLPVPPSGASPTGAVSSAGGICPAGCVSACNHPKFPLSSLSHLFPPSLTSSLAAAAAQAQQNAQRPYVCNWIVGDNYCGKRFPSSEELLQHLRTHTNSNSSSGSNSSLSSTSANDAATLAALVQQQHHQLAMASSASPSSSLYSSAANAALLNSSAMAAAAAAMHSPHSVARYHPYAAAALSSYYPYSALYGQR